MKQEQRMLAKQRRNQLNEMEYANYSADIVDKIVPLILKYDKIGIYLPLASEVDLRSLLRLDRTFYAPVVENETDMSFYELTSLQDTVQGIYSIVEPIRVHKVDPSELEVILIPLIAFDESLHRLGHGKGYYDRYLKQTKAIKIGVGFEVQKLSQIDTNEFDVRLDYIVSEKTVYHR